MFQTTNQTWHADLQGDSYVKSRTLKLRSFLRSEAGSRYGK